MNVDTIIKRVERLHTERAALASYWQDTANFCLPRKASITTAQTSGKRLDSFAKLFDSLAIRSLQTMGAGFASHLTNPSSKWFSLGTQNKALMESKDVKIWFKDAEDEIFSTLSTSNFYSTAQEFYLSAGCFGTGSILTEEDFKTRVRFIEIPIGQTYIEEDASGRVNRFYRKFEYTAQQAWDRWGKAAGQVVQEAMKEEKAGFLKKVSFIHAVFPREVRQEGKTDSQNLPYASVWLEVSKKHKISEGGFNEFPYAVGRFNKGEPWGYSPAMDVLADIKMLNKEKKTLIRAAMKIVDPPFVLPHKGFILPLNFNPSGVNYAKNALISDALRPIETRGNIPIGLDMILDVKKDIEEGFFVPLFKAFSQITKQMTVPEVQRRISENMVLLGPVVGRFTQEVFDPIITRVFMILTRQGVFPLPPPEIQGQELDIVYISQLAKAQRFSEINSVERTLETIGAISQYIPEVLDKINADKTADVIAEVNGVNPELIRDDEEVAEIREARRMQEEQAAKMATIQQGAETLKTASEADANLAKAGATK